MIPLLLHLLFANPSPSPAEAANPSWQAAAPQAFQTLDLNWNDATRKRDMPVRLRLPAGKDPPPVLLLSHGLGGSRDGISYLAEACAAQGWICLNLQHPGSDESIWKDKPLRERAASFQTALKDPRQAVSRAQDVSFAIDQLERLNQDKSSPLFGRVDLSRLALAGHSYGAWTSMACAGRQTAGPRNADKGDTLFGEKRLKAVIALSPQGQATLEAERLASSGIFLPALHITGAKDSSPIQNDMSPARRRLSFDASPEAAGSRFLLWFDVADHMVFNGVGKENSILSRARDGSHDAAIQSRVVQATLAFLAAEVLGKPQAERFLRDGSLQKLVNGEGKAESHLLPESVEQARLLLAHLGGSKYQHGPQLFTWPAAGKPGLAQGDCSGFVGALFERCHPELWAEMKNAKAKGRPLATDFATAIQAGKGFTRSDKVAELRPGDLLAVDYEDGAENTGHVMLADGPAVPRRDDTPPLLPGSKQWLIPVIDSSKSQHGPGDTRKDDQSGLGRGLLRLYADAEGKLIGWSWSSLKASQLYTTERPIVSGRMK